MRILYYINLDLAENKGVLQKIIDQVSTWTEQGCTVLIVSLSPPVEINAPGIAFSFFEGPKSAFYGENFFRSVLGTPPRHYKMLVDAAGNFNPDLIYFRDIFNLYIIRSFIRGFAAPKVYEANTLVGAQIQMVSRKQLKRFFDLLYFRVFTRRIYKGLNGAVAVTGEIAADIGKYVDNVRVIPNGIHYREIHKPERNNTIPNIVFIGSPGLAWHGVDKIIELAGLTQGALFFHVIGYTKPDGLVADNMLFYGNLEHREYEPVLLKADLAISSAAVYRKKINEGSGLKVREYLLYHLPVILPYKETIFSGDHDFVLQLPNSPDSLVSNVEKIITFARRWLNRQLETPVIRPLVDSKSIESRRLSFFRELLLIAKK